MHDDITTFVGLDVHKDSIAVAVAPAGRSRPRFVGTCGPKLAELIKAVSHVGKPAHTLLAYETGPCGFALARELIAAGWRCEVIAVSKVPVRPGERIKTDRRDALTLAGYLRAGELTPVVIPDARDEAIRDLSRAREDAVRARLKARQQINAMLLRHGQFYPGKTRWGPTHVRFSRMSPSSTPPSNSPGPSTAAPSRTPTNECNASPPRFASTPSSGASAPSSRRSCASRASTSWPPSP